MTPGTKTAVTDPDPLLDAIRRTPADRTLRLAYADWLEERGDPRYELVRVCEAMRDVPVYSDRYWALKARRNELWPRCPIEWLEATGYDGSYYDPVFRDGVPDDCVGRWRLVREYAERWCGIDVPDAGGRQDEVRAAEAAIGGRLRPALREWVAFAHDLRMAGTSTHDRRLESLTFDRFTLERDEEYPGVCVLYPNLAGGREWVPYEAWDDPDPPVFSYDYDADYDGDGTEAPWPYPAEQVSASLTWTALSLLGHELPTAGEIRGPVDDPAAVAERLAGDFPIRTRWANVDVFEADEVVVFLHHYPGASFPGYLHLQVRRPVPREAIPWYLWRENALTAGAFMGGRTGMVNVLASGILSPPQTRPAAPPPRESTDWPYNVEPGPEGWPYNVAPDPAPVVRWTNPLRRRVRDAELLSAPLPPSPDEDDDFSLPPDDGDIPF